MFRRIVADPLGRKRSMMLVNIPFGIAWFMMYKANSVPEIFIAASFLGLSVGTYILAIYLTTSAKTCKNMK